MPGSQLSATILCWTHSLVAHETVEDDYPAEEMVVMMTMAKGWEDKIQTYWQQGKKPAEVPQILPQSFLD